jgi:hypothetical protein
MRRRGWRHERAVFTVVPLRIAELPVFPFAHPVVGPAKAVVTLAYVDKAKLSATGPLFDFSDY